MTSERFPQYPGKSHSPKYTGHFYTTDSGHKLPYREVVTPDGRRHNVPRGVYYLAFQPGPNGAVMARWTFTIKGVNFYFLDRDTGSSLSLHKAIMAYGRAYDESLVVVKAMHAALHKGERQRKNVLTGIKQLTAASMFEEGILSYRFTLRMKCADGSKYQKSINFAYGDLYSIQSAYNALRTLKDQLDALKLPNRTVANAVFKQLSNGGLPVQHYALPLGFTENLAANKEMRLATRNA